MKHFYRGQDFSGPACALSDIKAGKKAWNPNLHGWLSCGEEE